MDYVTHIKYKNIEIDVFFDDYGQSYFVKFIDPKTGILCDECCGSYTLWKYYIEDRFWNYEDDDITFRSK